MKINLREDAYVINLFQQNRYSEARDFLIGRKTYYQQADRQLKCAYYSYLGKCCSMMGNYAAADDHFNMALNAIPHNYNAWLEMADSFMQRGDLRKAENVFLELEQHRSIENTGYQKRLTQLMGRFFKITGDYELSARCYEEFLKDRPNSIQGRKDFDFARQLIDQQARHGPAPVAGALEYAAYLHWTAIRMGGDTADLGMIFLKNRIQDIKHPDSKKACYWALTQYALEAGKIDQAMNFNQSAYGFDNNSARTLATRIRLLLCANDEVGAREHFEKDFATITDDVRIVTGLAESFLRAGVNDLAEHAYHYLATAPNIPSSSRTNAAKALSSMALARAHE